MGFLEEACAHSSLGDGCRDAICLYRAAERRPSVRCKSDEAELGIAPHSAAMPAGIAADAYWSYFGSNLGRRAPLRAVGGADRDGDRKRPAPGGGRPAGRAAAVGAARGFAHHGAQGARRAGRARSGDLAPRLGHLRRLRAPRAAAGRLSELQRGHARPRPPRPASSGSSAACSRPRRRKRSPWRSAAASGSPASSGCAWPTSEPLAVERAAIAAATCRTPRGRDSLYAALRDRGLEPVRALQHLRAAAAAPRMRGTSISRRAAR